MKKLLLPILIFIFLSASPSLVMAATLSLSPASGTFNKGCPFTLEIILDTQGAQTDGTDAILIYDSSRVSATTASIDKGTIYADYPGTNVDDLRNKIVISGLASFSSSFNGRGTFAKVNFTVKDNAPTGATMIKFDFDANDKTKTTDSNVVQRDNAVDLLSSVVDGNYIIGTGVCGAAVPTAPPVTILPGTGGPGIVYSTPSAQVPIKEIPYKILPPAGSEQLTFTIAIVGSVLTVLGILGLALL